LGGKSNENCWWGTLGSNDNFREKQGGNRDEAVMKVIVRQDKIVRPLGRKPGVNFVAKERVISGKEGDHLTVGADREGEFIVTEGEVFCERGMEGVTIRSSHG